jgi:transcriptional regulator
MYIPPAFRETELSAIHATMRACRLPTLVTATAEGLVASPLPLLFDAGEGEHGTLYGHLAKANPQARLAAAGEAMVVFQGAEAYVTPAWYENKPVDGKVVPTWNYVAVHAYAPLEIFDDAERLLTIVRRLTDAYEAGRAEPWSVEDAPADFIASMLKGIVGLRLPISRLDAKTKMSQNRKPADRAAVAAGLVASDDPRDQAAAAHVPVSRD